MNRKGDLDKDFVVRLLLVVGATLAILALIFVWRGGLETGMDVVRNLFG